MVKVSLKDQKWTTISCQIWCFKILGKEEWTTITISPQKIKKNFQKTPYLEDYINFKNIEELLRGSLRILTLGREKRKTLSINTKYKIPERKYTMKKKKKEKKEKEKVEKKKKKKWRKRKNEKKNVKK